MGLYFLLIIALLYSFFLITLSNIMLLVLGLIYLSQHHRTHNWRWLPVSLLALGFVPYLQGLLISEESGRALREVQHNLAYLSLPLAVIWLPRLRVRQRDTIFAFFIGMLAVSTVPVLANYVMDFEAITKSLGKGKAIPTPIDHVRYSIFLAIACTFSLVLYLRKESFGKKSRRSFLILSFYLFIVLHVMAVRSGIILSYVGLFLAALLYLWKLKKFLLIGALFFALALSPIAAYYTIPSFHTKIHYTLYDYGKQQAGEGANYSDSERIRSYKIGIDIWKDHKFLGMGTGDLTRELNNRYAMVYPDGGRAFLPHNQVIKFMATSGLIGLAFFLLSVYVPFFYNGNYKKMFVLALLGIMTVSFMVEATLERSYMLNLYLLLTALLYRGCDPEVEEIPS